MPTAPAANEVQNTEAVAAPESKQSEATATPAAATKPAAKKAPKKKEKKTVKTAAKKPAAKKVTKVTKPAKKTAAPKTETDPKVSLANRQAKSIGVGRPQYLVLQALRKVPSGMGYNGIKDKTGYYSTLTAMLRAEHEGSLAALKYVKESEMVDGNRTVLVFTITAAGKAALDKAVKVD